MTSTSDFPATTLARIVLRDEELNVLGGSKVVDDSSLLEIEEG